MAKKQLNTDAIANELRNSSVFFRREETPKQKEAEPNTAAAELSTHEAKEVPKQDGIVIPRHRDTTVSRDETSPADYAEQMIELIRGAVKQLGKEAATHRFTIEEKRALANIVFEYRDKQIRTSENEIARIAINFLVQDYRERGADSLLAKVLARLNT